MAYREKKDQTHHRRVKRPPELTPEGERPKKDPHPYLAAARSERLMQSGGGIAVCEQCGSTFNLQDHHVKPRSLGGDDSIENQKYLCEYCHRLAEGITTT